MAGLAIGADDKKKIYVLGGLLAAIGVVVVVLYVPRGGSKTKPTPAATPTPTTVAQTPATPGADGAPAGASAAPGSINAASLVSIESFRNDPFAPFARPPLPRLPAPRPKPAPPAPPRPVVILPPDQVEILPPGQSDSGGGYSSGGMGLPPMDVIGGRSTSSSRRALVDLPPVTLPTRSNIPRTPGPPGGQSAGGISASPNKRISGVIIGDSVRALLEITDGDIITTRIVQPGDEVDGIRILRIERITEGGRSITRMIIRENGEERSVDLKAAPKDATVAGIGGVGGLPGRF